jgi:hypothetical protein
MQQIRLGAFEGERLEPGCYVTYIRNVSGLHGMPSGGEIPPLLAGTGTAQVFQSGLSAGGQAIGQMPSPGVRMSFQQPLPSKPSEIAVKGAPVGNWRK